MPSGCCPELLFISIRHEQRYLIQRTDAGFVPCLCLKYLMNDPADYGIYCRRPHIDNNGKGQLASVECGWRSRREIRLEVLLSSFFDGVFLEPFLPLLPLLFGSPGGSSSCRSLRLDGACRRRSNRAVLAWVVAAAVVAAWHWRGEGVNQGPGFTLPSSR